MLTLLPLGFARLRLFDAPYYLNWREISKVVIVSYPTFGLLSLHVALFIHQLLLFIQHVLLVKDVGVLSIIILLYSRKIVHF